ncbi:MAG: type B chloramphenicol O-acetyltransferase, partial [Bacteroidales bacterium]
VVPYSVTAGNPATFKKIRFPLGTIRQLVELKWWDWPEDIIREAIPILMSGDVEKLFEFGKAVNG